MKKYEKLSIILVKMDGYDVLSASTPGDILVNDLWGLPTVK